MKSLYKKNNLQKHLIVLAIAWIIHKTLKLMITDRIWKIENDSYIKAYDVLNIFILSTIIHHCVCVWSFIAHILLIYEYSKYANEKNKPWMDTIYERNMIQWMESKNRLIYHVYCYFTSFIMNTFFFPSCVLIYAQYNMLLH